MSGMFPFQQNNSAWGNGGMYSGAGIPNMLQNNSAYQNYMTNASNFQNQQLQHQMNMNPMGLSGGPINGMVGAPNLGMASSLSQFALANPGNAQYLQRMGMMPTVNGVAVNSGGPSATVTNDGYQSAQRRAGGTQLPNGGWGYPNPPSASSAGQQWGQQNGMGNMTDIQRQQSPFEQQLQNSTTNLLNNPTGYTQQQQAMLQNQASQPYAYAEQQAMDQTREDAARRGAASNDAQIGDQLNRVRMSGANQQQQAQFGVQKMLADLAREGTLGGLGAGNQLLGAQLGDIKSLREMITMLNALQQQQGNTNFGFLLGGK